MIALLAVGPSAASAELVGHGDLFLRFQGALAPRALPRHRLVPIEVRLAATVSTLSDRRPPPLRRITVELGRGGRLDSRGLPGCSVGQLAGASPRQAMTACRASLVGHGSFRAANAFPEQPTFPAAGHILAFNARGQEALLAQLYGTQPASITRILVFHIHRSAGRFGTLLSASLPASINRYGYLRSIRLALHRTFIYRGRLHGYVSAACAAPPGVPAALFPFARASMRFADGRTLSSTLTRSCRVR